MNINGFIPILKNTLDTIIRKVNILTVFGGGSCSVDAAWRVCRGSPAFTSRDQPSSGRPPGSNLPLRG